MTPILDMVFQLITFFMLVINFKSAALDLKLQLPVLGSARPLDTQGQEDLIVLNIDAEGRLNLYGVEKDTEAYIAEEARVALQKLQKAGKQVQPGDELPTTVVIRADRLATFDMVYSVISTCQAHGFTRFALKAMSSAAGGA